MLICLSGLQKPASQEQIKKNVDPRPMQGYLVPTPLVVASSSLGSVAGTKPVTPVGNTANAMPQFVSKNSKSAHKHNEKPTAPPVPSEANVMPASTKTKDYSVRPAEGPLPRGPLSYEALVHLRRNASTKKTPLCPTVDHTIDLSKCHPAAVEPLNLQRSDKFHSEVFRSKMDPPVVAPKPKLFPANIPLKTQNKEPAASHFSKTVKHANDPKMVRLEALQKLGLLKDQEPEDGAVAPLPPPKPLSSFDPTPKRFTSSPFNCNPSRSPSFCSSQMPTEPKTKVLQSSASFSNHSRHDQQPVSASHHPAQHNGLRRTGLERSTSLDNYTNSGSCSERQHNLLAKPVKIMTTDESVPDKPPNSVGYTVMLVPGMGADRKEALRKLGLLKN